MSNSNFTDFQYHEYDNIAQAHFKTSETISEFFKHYITIVTIPIPLFAVLINLDSVNSILLDPLTPLNTMIIFLAGVIFFSISLAGYLVMIYIFNLRWDALLYARTVNSIRKYFFDQNQDINLIEKQRLRVLPQSSHFPRYYEFNYFGSVVVTFALFNSLYLFLSLIMFFLPWNHITTIKNVLIWVVVSIYLISHLITYYVKAKRREEKYLRSNIIGVDIDGVLNLHRDKFCEIYNIQTGKVIHPEQLTELPVRNCPGLGITKEEEINVFNSPSYWIDMPSSSGVGSSIKNIKNSLQLKVYIFTSRPWPILKEESKELLHQWKTESAKFEKNFLNQINFFERFMYSCRNLKSKFISKKNLIVFIKKSTYIEKITRVWLNKNKIPYDALVVERGSEHVSIPSSKTYNRFYFAEKFQIKFFIEDDLQKAIKLSYICDTIFLINHPYNQSGDLPSNIIRVNNFNDIYEYLKKSA